MERIGHATISETMKILIAILRKLKDETELVENRQEWNVIITLAESCSSIMGIPIDAEARDWIPKPLLGRFSKHLLSLFMQLDKARYVNDPGASIFNTCLDSLEPCFPRRNVDAYRIELMESIEICEARLKNAKKKVKDSMKDEGLAVDGQVAPGPVDLRSFMSPGGYDSYSKRRNLGRVKRLSKELTRLRARLEDAVIGCKLDFLARLPLLVDCYEYFEGKQPRDEIAMLLDLARAVLREVNQVRDVADLLPFLGKYAKRVPVSENERLPEREMLEKLNKSIKVDQERLDNALARLSDDSLDDDEKRYLIDTRNRLTSILFEERHRQQLLENRLGWKEPERQRESNARCIIDALGEMKRRILET